MKDPAWMRDKLQALSVEVDEMLGSCHMTEDDYRDYLEVARNVMANGAAVIAYLMVVAEPVKLARWILEDSPYAEYEEGVDGESHPRYVCSLCKTEAPFGCDPDGFATFQERSDYCPGCGAKIDLED